MRPCTVLSAALILSQAAIAATIVLWSPRSHADQRYEGVAYAPGSQRVLYRETHWLYRQDGIGRRLVLYRCAQGEPFARKQVVDSPSASAPDFDFVDARDGYEEGALTRQGKRYVYTRKNSAAARKETALPDRAGAVMDAGFDAMVRARWDALSKNQSVPAPFLLPSRAAFLDFRVTPVKAAGDTPSVRHLRMALDTWYGFAVPPIELRYAVADRRLLEFRGITTIRDRDGRYQNARIEFAPPQEGAAASAEQRQAAQAQALSKRCPGDG